MSDTKPTDEERQTAYREMDFTMRDVCRLGIEFVNGAGVCLDLPEEARTPQMTVWYGLVLTLINAVRMSGGGHCHYDGG